MTCSSPFRLQMHGMAWHSNKPAFFSRFADSSRAPDLQFCFTVLPCPALVKEANFPLSLSLIPDALIA